VTGSLTFLSLDDASEVFAVAMTDGALLPVYEIAGTKGAPALLFGHANGMAAGSYGPWLKRLAARTHVFAFDARGHGGSTWPEGRLEEVFSVDRMADDLAAVTRAVAARVGGAPLAYAGHSLGGASALWLAMRGEAPRWSAAMIFEPPIFPPPTSPLYAAATEKQIRLVEGTQKRRTHWPSPDALAERLKGRGMFARFDPAMLAAHCRATLKPAAEGGYRLCCPPPVEGFIFKSHWQAGSWARLGDVSIAVDLIGGDADVPDNDWVSAALPEMARQIAGAHLTQVKGAGHLLISEQPEFCAHLVWQHMAAL